MLNNLGESAELLERFVGDYGEEARRGFFHVPQRDQELIAVGWAVFELRVNAGGTTNALNAPTLSDATELP